MLRYILAPLALLYGLAVKIRNTLFDWQIITSKEFDVPTICVGNLAVGGTGKTPHVEFLIEELAPALSLALLSRGYGRKTKGFRWVTQDSTAQQVGDEPLQIKIKYPNVTVAVCESRVRGVETLLKQNPSLGAVLLDDAFQHRYLKAGMNILLTDYSNLFTRDYFLPFGTLRDSIAELHRADMVVVTKCPPSIKPIEQRIITNELGLMPYQSLYFTALAYGLATPVFSTGNHSLSPTQNTHILALSGIANTQPFTAYISALGNLWRSIEFPDHAHYTKRRVDMITQTFRAMPGEARMIITTEKDAARLRGIVQLDDDVKEALYYIPIRVGFIGDTGDEFITKLKRYVRQSKRNRNAHTEQG